MRYFIIILFLFIFIFSFGTARAGDGSYQKVSDYAKHIFDFVKQEANEISEDAQEEITKKAEQATEEIKQKIKERIKNKIINTFSPLKTKIQRGSALIRERIEQAKNYLFN